jgi:mRNA-degrading endonuclease RelE of RelBE toxin-antitoxin system
MYRFIISEEALEELRNLRGTKYESGVRDNLRQLSENPHKKAKETKVPVHGTFYVNAGNQYCITFDIDEENETIVILRVLRQQYLYKLMHHSI